MNTSPIIIIDDDDDDLDLIKQAFAELKVTNDVLIFNNGDAFLEYMRATERGTFFILCDFNMAKISGLELKRRIYDDERLRLKCVPFIFIFTSRASASIMGAYSFGVQGYFIKPSNYEGLKGLLQRIMLYWSDSQHPNCLTEQLFRAPLFSLPP